MTEFFKPAPEPPTELGRFRTLSPLAGLRVSPLCLGAMNIGDSWQFMGHMSKEQSFALLDAYVAAGGNFIDTANSYQNEQSETWLGEWMAQRQNRDRLVIATKYSNNYLAHELGKGVQSGGNYYGNHRRSMLMSVRDSLSKLQTDWIDILYVHWWDYTTSIEEVMDSLHMLVEQGKVLYLGVSNTPAWVVSAANTYARAHGKTPFCIYQGKWNVLVRDLERDILPMARQFGMAIHPWEAVGGGHFQTRAAVDERKQRGEALRSSFKTAQSEDEIAMSDALEAVAKEHGTASVTAIALAYLLAKAPYVFPIVGGRKVEHLHDNITALSIRLTEEQIQRLESVRPFDHGLPMNQTGTDPALTGFSPMHSSQATVAFVRSQKPIGYE